MIRRPPRSTLDRSSAASDVYKRQTEDWGEDTATWATPPAVDKTSAGTVPFKHGTGSGDYSPRHQVITDGNLLSQVSLYYQVPLVNFGWSIQQDCGPSKADCEASAPGFRMRTREWPTASQRPTLSIVFQPNNDPGMQLQNAVSYTHLRAHETVLDLVCRLLLEKKKSM